ncbi:MAG: energy transducer TonB [Burkholderiales bacterium]
MSARALRQYQSSNASGRATGWVVVIGLHVLVAYALISGTARKGLELIKKPLEAVVIQEVIILPPPPPTPTPTPTPTPRQAKPVKPNALKVEAPPLFIPPPEVVPALTATPAIAAVITSPLAPPVIAPPPEPAKPTATRAEIGVVCPTQVRPEMPRKALRDGTEGVVRAQAVIRDGQVKEVIILSGPSVFHGVVREAMRQYKCNSDSGDALAQQEFVFRVQ